MRRRPPSMAKARFWLVPLALLAPSIATAQRGGGTVTCRPADATTSAVIAGLRRIVSNNDTSVVATRTQMQLPTVPISSVVLVTDNAICSKVAQAYNAALPSRTPPISPSSSVYVVQVGSVYVVHDSAQVSGEWTFSMTVSNKYKVLAQHSR